MRCNDYIGWTEVQVGIGYIAQVSTADDLIEAQQSVLFKAKRTDFNH